MKELVKFEKEVGGDGAKAAGVIKVEGDQLKATVEIGMPLSKVVEPVMTQFDKLVDKLEALIPGDQKAMAATLKAEAREELVKLLSE